MKIVTVDELPKFVLPQHYGVYSQEIRGPNTGNTDVSVLFTAMEAEGGAEIHTHDIQEHIFYVLEGELQVSRQLVDEEVADQIVSFYRACRHETREALEVGGVYFET